MTRHATIGFIGLGHMGAPMARNLLDDGRRLVVYDRDHDAVARTAALGAHAVASAAEVGREAGVVIVSLPGPAELERVVLGDGLSASMSAGDAIVCVSTVGQQLVRRLSDELATAGIAFIDAPVSGGVDVAAAGELTITVGADREQYERHLDVLRVLGRHVHHTGPVGTGSTAKLITNMLAFVHTVAMLDALALGVKAGMTAEVIGRVISTSISSSYASEHYLPDFLADRDDDSFPLSLCCKDIRLATATATELEAPQPLISLIGERFELAMEQFGPTAGAASLKRMSERAAGASLSSGSSGESGVDG